MRKPISKSGGFTLIEIMVTVAILAIIATVAIPSYQRQSLKSKRADGIAMLMDAAAKQERYAIDPPNLYTANMALLGYTSPFASVQGYYQISAVLGAGSLSYTLTAKPQPGQDADECKSLTLDNTGTRGWTGTTGSPAVKVANCW